MKFVLHVVNHQRCVMQVACLILLVTGFAKGSCAAPDRIQILNCSQEALSARLAFISNAQNEIVISSYYVEPGKATDLLLAALVSSADRGVQVRLLLDARNMGLKSSQLARLHQAGVSIRLFHPQDKGGVHWFNRRLHSKLLVVDQKLLIIGSRNLRDKHFGLDSKNYIDIDLAIEGSSAKQAADYFDWIWNSNQVQAPKLRGMTHTGPIAATALDPAHFPFDFAPNHNATTCCLYDANFEKSNRRMQQQRIAWVKSAKRSLIIETPYPAFAKKTLAAICESARSGVNVQIITNSLATTDQILPFAGYKNSQRRLLAAGVKIYEFQGPESLHAKVTLIDGQAAVIGSHNFDARSDNFNLEFGVRVNCPEFVNDVNSRLCQHKSHSKQILSPRLDRSDRKSRQKLIGLRARQLAVPFLRPLL